MAIKPHIKLNSRKQKDKPVTMSFNYGFGNTGDEEPEEVPNYAPMAERFRGSLVRLNNDLATRHEERNDTLPVPAHFDFIKILFYDQFEINKFYQSWYNDFGLLGVNFSQFNREVLFAVVNQDLFASFLNDIQNFIIKESGEDEQVKYRGKIKYIEEFDLLTTEDILKYEDRTLLMNFKLIDFPGGSPEADAIYNQLEVYLQENAYDFNLVEDGGLLEVYGASQERIEEIVKNFDILLNVTSSLSTVVRPSDLNTVEKGYGFEISNSDEALPIIGVLDTGISNITPLAPIVLDDDRFNLTNTSPFVDNANDGYGHGTSIAALAALGRDPYASNFIGNFRAHAKLLSMKILDANSGYISIQDVLRLLEGAKQEYPEMKLFVLTTCFTSNKATNEDFSTYAYKLDKFAYENDCLISICTANNNDAAGQWGYDLNFFANENTNICSPAESMNNLIVGAAADNLNGNGFMGISNAKEFPTLYTRKSHFELTDLFPQNKQNKNLFRPDVIESGGDYEQSGIFIGVGDQASMEVLSANPAFGFYKESGTSFSTPLVANIAAQILRDYPSLKTQTIKALIVNGASLDKIPFDQPVKNFQNKSSGHGLVNSNKSIRSDDNTITFIIEDKIAPDEMKIVPLNFPSYLTQSDLGKSTGILKLTATLCFSFDPVQNNHLGYCPIQMAFSFFRNHSGTQILEKEVTIKSKLKNGWSQNNRWKSKPIPASNTQKIQIPISVKDLTDENSTFKLAIHCLLNTQLLSDQKYKTDHAFSMAITIEENLPEARKTGKLYAEMVAINEIENIAQLEAEADIELEG